MRNLIFFTCAVFWVSQFFLSGCAHKKTVEPLTREQLQAKRVAFAEIKGGAPESRSHVEVAVVNEILDHGRFEIVDRATVQEALVTYPTESDWQRLGQKVGADYILSIRIAEFSVNERQGYDKVIEEDSVLTQESGSSGAVMGTRYVKVKSNQGFVKLYAILFNVAENTITYQGAGTASETISSRDQKKLGKMALLEKLSRQAITDFFEKMPK